MGKSAKPREFPQNMKHFPVTYESNKTAWMTADIWSRYLMSWDAQLRIEGRFILLLADNAPGHKEVTLTNIHVEYMPKNTTSLIQPADAGIIKCFKGYYRNLTVQKCLYMVEEKKAMGLTVLGSDMAKKIT